MEPLVAKMQQVHTLKPIFLSVFTPWGAGVILGNFLAASFDGSVLSQVQQVTSINVSFIGSIVFALMPLLFIRLIVSLFGIRFLPVYLLTHATIVGLICGICARCFGSAGWLIVPILLASNLFCAYVCVSYVVDLFLSNGDVSRNKLLAYFSTIVVFCCFNCFVVSPFLMSFF